MKKIIISWFYPIMWIGIGGMILLGVVHLLRGTPSIAMYEFAIAFWMYLTLKFSDLNTQHGELLNDSMELNRVMLSELEKIKQLADLYGEQETK